MEGMYERCIKRLCKFTIDKHELRQDHQQLKILFSIIMHNGYANIFEGNKYLRKLFRSYFLVLLR